MNTGMPLLACGVGCWLAAIAIGGPESAPVTAAARALVRPLTLPVAFATLQQAMRQGDAEETFARAQQLLDQLPAWTDGHTLFAWRFALDGGERLLPAPARAAAALQRLRVALAWLELAHDRNPGHRADVLASMAFLVEIAADRQPELAALLRAEPGGRTPAEIADAYLARAEQATGSLVVRERRLFFTPILVADLLRVGAPERALDVVRVALTRCDILQDRGFAQEWRESLERLARRLGGDRSVTVEELARDPRLDPVLPFLRQ